ncbi:pilus assembly PilX family protein [Motilimonas cestriensis]|uniref:pilus assembly PilX family protein n=1 Tax=Motilimonas cestriensis TaxID=2742685 RepID=UPI003DA1CEE8
MKITQLSNKQSGLAMLTVTLLLLISATSFTFFSVKSRVMETKIAANDYRYREAFINAEAGLDHALSVMNSKGWSTSGLPKASITTDIFKYTITAPSDNYSVVIKELCEDCDLVKVVSTGYGDSKQNQKILSRIAIAKTGVGAIEAPFITAGGTTMVGSINADATSISPTPAKYSIQAGGKKIDKAGSLQINGVDTKTNDASLRGDNFFNFLGTPQAKWETVKTDTPNVVPISGCTGLEAAVATAPTPKTIWVTGDCDIGLSKLELGDAAAPVTIILQDGNIVMGETVNSSGVVTDYGELKINGLLYAFDTTNITSPPSQKRLGIDGRLTVRGAAIFDYKYTYRFNGSVHVLFHSGMLNDRYGDSTTAYWVPGGWSDFDA